MQTRGFKTVLHKTICATTTATSIIYTVYGLDRDGCKLQHDLLAKPFKGVNSSYVSMFHVFVILMLPYCK